MKKAEAIGRVNRYLGDKVLNYANTSFSNVNAAKSVWWLNIRPKKFTNDLHILLAKRNDNGLIWLKIKAKTITNPEKAFRIRDTGAVHLEISCDGNRYLHDIKGGGTDYNFSRHIEHEWK